LYVLFFFLYFFCGVAMEVESIVAIGTGGCHR